MPLLLALGVIVFSCAVLTPGRVNASAGTPARGSCDTLTPDPVDGLFADPPPVHAVDEEDSVGTYTIGGGAAVVVGAGTGGTGCGNGRSWSGVSTPDGRVAGGRLLGCCALS